MACELDGASLVYGDMPSLYGDGAFIFPEEGGNDRRISLRPSGKEEDYSKRVGTGFTDLLLCTGRKLIKAVSSCIFVICLGKPLKDIFVAAVIIVAIQKNHYK